MRLHLFEFLDQPWYPRLFRDLQTDMIQHASGSAYNGVAPLIARVLKQVGEAKVIDLCSGAGGPWPSILPLVEAEEPRLSVKLSDRYPNLPMFERLKDITGGKLDYVKTPVAADAVPAELQGARTVFQGFHHLRPRQATAVLQDAAEHGRAIAVFDVMSPRKSLGAMLPLLLPLPLIPLIFIIFSWITVPRLRTVTLPRLVFTYLIPLVPLATAWDYVVSALRAYTVPELEDMVATLRWEGYTWEVGQLTSGKIPINYVLGVPQ